MEYKVLEPRETPPQSSSCCYLIEDRWDDWGKFATQYRLVVFDAQGNKHVPGSVKIASEGLAPHYTKVPGSRTAPVPTTFKALDDSFFSLGQNESYYETLNALPGGIGQEVLYALRDCALDPSIFKRFQSELAMSQSLLRFVNTQTVLTRFARLARGDAELTPFHFVYTIAAARQGARGPGLMFSITPSAFPPQNVHVLIGRNGAGKTRCLEGMVASLVDTRTEMHGSGSFTLVDGAFAGVVYVTFSAFSRFAALEPALMTTGLRFTHVGLPNNAEAEIAEALADSFVESLSHARSGLRQRRWREAVGVLENDPLFRDTNIRFLVDAEDDKWRNIARSVFSRLSSGHAIVLLTITRLVELVDEKTFVLMDEPECHLHPPLLSSFVRALNQLLIARNGAAVIATHSPVVLQEVPRSCVWIIRRSGASSVAERPEIETFGENVGTLTREVFGLEVESTGFHQMLKDAARVHGATYESIVEQFSGQLGAEARAILHGLVSTGGSINR